MLPLDLDFEARCRSSFTRQAFMATLGARLASIEPGQVVIELPFRTDLTQQHGFLHAGVLAAVLDSACGYAALSLMAPGSAVLTVEFKINLMKPAAGTLFRAAGKVIRAGHTLTICNGEMHAQHVDKQTVIAVMQSTMMAVSDRKDLAD
jgi:uncharacterized protein (TIGR00369 family)